MTWQRQPASSLVSRSADYGLDRADAKVYLRIDASDEDALVDTLIQAAASWVESYTRRALVSQTFDLRYAGWPSVGAPLVVPHAPLASVTSITYLDVDGAAQTWASSNYHVRTLAGVTAGRGWIEVADGATVPTVAVDADAPVIVRAVCGYGAVNSAVPAGIKAAMLLLLGDLYERRQETLSGGTSRTETTVKRLLAPFRLPEAA